MLPPDYLNGLESQIANLYAELDLDIIVEISDRINNVGYANTVVKNDVIIAQQSGMLYTNIINAVAKNTQKNYNEIAQIFLLAGIKSITIDDKVYKKAGLNPIPIKQDKSMLNLLTAMIEKTNNNLSNLCSTTATESQTEFINAMNRAFLEVSTGAKSYSRSIMDAIDNMAEKGGYIRYPSGYRTSLENATRMNIVTGVNQTCGKMQYMRAEELGWDLMEITAFPDSRPTHAEWQGKIVSLSGKAGYLSLEDIGYGQVDGFQGINCRHDWSPYYEGSSRTYSNELLDKYNNTKVSYNGKEMSLYEAEQIQRKLERQIRTDKKKIASREHLLTNSSTLEKTEKEIKASLNYQKARLALHKEELNDFVDQTSLKQEKYRTEVYKKGNYRTTSVVNYAKKLYNKDSKIDNLQSFVDDETIRKHIRNNKNLTLNRGQQDKHIEGTNNYNTEIKNGRNPSKILANNDEIEKIVQKYAGTGRIIRKADKSFNNKEFVIIKELLGLDVDEDTKIETETHNFIIHYANDGVHIVPTK